MAIGIGTRGTVRRRVRRNNRGTVRGVIETDLTAVHRLNGVPAAWGVHPSVAEVVKIGKKPLQVYVCSRLEVVVHPAGEAVPRAVVRIRPEIFGTNHSYGSARRRIGSRTLRRLQVVDAPVVAIEGASEHNAKFLALAEALAHRAVKTTQGAPALNRRVSALASKIVARLFPGGSGDQIDRAADAVGVLTGGKRLEHFDALDKVRRNCVQLDVADGAFRRRHVHAVDGYVAQARLGAANLHVLSFAFIALQGNARGAANGVGDVGIRQAVDDLRRQHLHDVVRHALDIDSLRLALQAFRRDQHLIALGSNLQHRIDVRRLPRFDLHAGA